VRLLKSVFGDLALDVSETSVTTDMAGKDKRLAEDFVEVVLQEEVVT
jgi:hypothetical protein